MNTKYAAIISIFILVSFICGYGIGIVNYSNLLYDLNLDNNETFTKICEEPESLLENCPSCADKYFLIVESETFDFYVPYGSREIILGAVPENTKDCRIKACVEYGFNFKEKNK